MADVQHTVCVSPFRHIGKPNHELPAHWAILLLDNPHNAWFYQIEGTFGRYGLAPVLYKRGFKKSGTYKGAYVVGSITTNQRDLFEETIRKVPIHSDRADWNSHNWVVSALQKLEYAGLLPADGVFTLETLTTELKEVEEQHDAATNVSSDEN